MIPWRTIRLFIPGFLLIVGLWESPRAVRAQEPDEILPANIGSFVQVNDLATWRSRLTDVPAVRYFLKLMPHQRHHQAWHALEDVLGMDGNEIIDRYFGTRLVLAGPRPGWNEPIMMLLKVQPEDTQRLIQRLELQPIGDVGAFSMYSTPDDSTHMAARGPWISIANVQHDRWQQQTLLESEAGPLLANDAEYQHWTRRLPEEGFIRGFFRGHDSGHIAAISLAHERRRLTLHYAGQPPESRRLMASLGDASVKEFGPLPRATLAAISINVLDRHPPYSDAVDRLLAPKTLEGDIMPKLDTPLLFFLGEISREQMMETQTPRNVRGDVPAAIPVIGMAVRLRDRQVARDLSLILDNLALIANVATAPWGTPPMITETVRRGETTYHSVEIGPVLAQRMGHDELSPVRLAYGRVGDWFVLCTHDRFMDACINAANDETLRLTADPSFTVMPLKDLPHPILSGLVRGPATASHLRTWIDYWRVTRPEVLELALQPNPQDLEPRIAKTVMALVDIFEGFESATVQFNRAHDDAVIGRGDLVR